MADIEILECTLRDGSYPVSYQFTVEDTAVIAAGLEEAGFARIEIGHGLGLGASTPEIGVAAATDQEYLEAAASVLDSASFGAFFIPGIGEAHHIRLAADAGAEFIRVGTNVTTSEDAVPYIEQAKELGLEVSSNLMKTYAVEVDEVVRRARELDKTGVDVIAIVDSAGTMLPDEVREYVRSVDEHVDAAVGFHGHDNLRLAIANTLAAIDAGAQIVDTSLRGLGRSAGNAQTEVMVAVLERRGIDTGIDLFSTMSISEELISPLAQSEGVDPVELCSGYGGFHSKFLPIVRSIADEVGVDVRRLVLQICEHEKVDVTEEIVREAALEITAESPRTRRRQRRQRFEIDLPDLQHGEPGDWKALAHRVADELSTISKKTDKTSVFTIAWSPDPGNASPRFPFIRGDGAYVIGNAEVTTVEQARVIADIVDSSVDFVAADLGNLGAEQPPLSKAITGELEKSQLVPYRDHLAHVDAAYALLLRRHPDIEDEAISVVGLSNVGTRIAVRLVERGCHLAIWDPSQERRIEGHELVDQWQRSHQKEAQGSIRLWEPSNEEVSLLLGTAVRDQVVTGDLVESIEVGGSLLDLGVGSLTPAAVRRASERKVDVHRLDMRAGLVGHLTTAIETEDLVGHVQGSGSIAGFTVVAGGAIGQRGDIVVDAAHDPTQVIGVADGSGGLLELSEKERFSDRIEAVQKAILKRRLDACAGPDPTI